MTTDYHDIIHGIDDNAKLLLVEIANSDGSIDESELQNELYRLYGELGALSVLEWVSPAKSDKWLTQSGKNLKLTNTGWALVEGRFILGQLEKLVGEGEFWPDFVDDDSPCIVFHLSSDTYSQADVESILADATGKLTSTARVTGIQTELPLDTSWLILFD